MSLEIERNVDMKVRPSGEPLPTIPWDNMFLKDAVDITVGEEELSRRLSAVRSAYKRWQDRQTSPDQKEFHIGKLVKDGVTVVRVYCKKGPSRDEDNESSQSQHTDSQSPIEG
tara:strand:+ start:1202 stop:1540 length:339 start_codon:yes stop_codon:yes gene_type:complete